METKVMVQSNSLIKVF